MPQSKTRSIEELEKENQRLFSLLEANAILSSSLHLNKVLDALLNKAREICSAEASSLMLLDEEKQELYFYTIKSEETEALKNIRLKMGAGIAGWVAQNGQAVLVEDCNKDARFSREADQVSSFQTRSMMCVPLMAKGRVLGTLQVLNCLEQEQQGFTQKDMHILQILTHQAAITIENARLHTMATIDATTGLYMKNYFMACLEEEYQRARRSGNSLSLLMSDIDLFRKVNDTYGHQGGDAVLVALAKMIRETIYSLESENIAGRYGGEEFCVLLPGRDEHGAKEVGELIRKNIEKHPIPVQEGMAHITISIGYVTFPLHAVYLNKSEDFIKLADEALYLCKERGRNCVRSYSEKLSGVI